MVHCGMFHKFMLSYHDKIREENAFESDEHPFIRGLNTLGVADVIDYTNTVVPFSFLKSFFFLNF